MASERGLERIVQDAIDNHLQSRSKLYLEAAICALLDVFTIDEICTILRDSADHLEEFG